MGKPAARLTDMHTCPMVTPGTPPIPHIGGPVSGPCVPPVLIGFLPAATVGDMCACVGPPDTIAMGSSTVLIGGKMAARMGDPTVHGGVIVVGCPTVLIGDAGSGSGGASSPSSFFSDLLASIGARIASLLGEEAPPTQATNKPSLESIAKGVNPDNGTINCGNIIDAVIARLNGSDPNAVAPVDQDGSFPQIEARHNTSLEWGKSFDDAYRAVEDAGDGAVAIVGIEYSGGMSSHVVVMTNQNGTVAIIEGQAGGHVVASPAQANKMYNSDGGSNVGYGLLPK